MLTCGKCGNDDQSRISAGADTIHCVCGNIETIGVQARWPFKRSVMEGTMQTKPEPTDIITTVDKIEARPGHRLTPYREAEIARMIREGKPQREIVDKIGTSTSTVTKVRAKMKAIAAIEHKDAMREKPDVDGKPISVAVPDSVLIGMIPTIAQHIVDHFPDLLGAEITKALSLKKVVFEIGGNRS